MLLHTWHATLISNGSKYRFGGTDYLPECDRSRRYDHPALEQLVAAKADAEFGAGNWQFANPTDPFSLNALVASDGGAR